MTIILKDEASDRRGLGASRRISEFAVGFSTESLLPEHRHQVARALVDTIASAVAGRGEDAAVKAMAYVRDREAGHMARAWGLDQRLPVEDAAFYNGVAAHVLDFDDVTSPLRGHPSVGLLPGLIALAEAHGKTGLELAASYVLGFDVLCKLAKTLAERHYAKGWHSTSSIGTIASAVACAHLLGLDARRIESAIGLAVAQAAGSRRNFGFMAKSFQAGHCAAAGVRAARLAQLGFTASPDALDRPYGYMDLYADGEVLDEQLLTLGHPLEIETSGLEVKKYPMCYATHRALDGLLDLRAEHALTLDQIESVRIVTSHGGLVPLIYTRPQTGLEGKFSMQYAVAAALCDGRIRLSSFVDEAVLRPRIQQFFGRIHIEESPGTLFPRWAKLKILTHDGRTLEKMVTTLRGAADCPLSTAELIDKAVDCFDFGQCHRMGRHFAQTVLSLGAMPVQDMLDRAFQNPEGCSV